MIRHQDLLTAMFDAAIESTRPETCLPAWLPEPPTGTTHVIGFGKAASAMGAVLEAHWTGSLQGKLVNHYGASQNLAHLSVMEAAHPVPDANGATAAEALLEIARNAGQDDLVLCLISGGGSALTTLPPNGVSLEDMQALNTALLKSGAPIDEINTVRRHISRFNGGRLAEAAAPAKLVSLIISDVVGDSLPGIASGPTVADASSLADARAVLDRYKITPPASIAAALRDPANESIKPGHDCFAHAENHIIASNKQALDAAANIARDAGWPVHILGDDIEGDAATTARNHTDLIRQYAAKGEKLALLSGGELTVVVNGDGKGGPSHDYALALLAELGDDFPWAGLIADSDGMDGISGGAGAFIDHGSSVRAKQAGLDPAGHLQNSDSGGFFHQLGNQFVIPPTGTNVNDLRFVLING